MNLNPINYGAAGSSQWASDVAEAKSDSSPPPSPRARAGETSLREPSTLNLGRLNTDFTQINVCFEDGQEASYCLQQLRQLGGLFDDLQPTADDEIPLPVSRAGFNTLIALINNPATPLSPQQVREVLLTADKLNNEAAIHTVIQQLMHRASKGDQVQEHVNAVPHQVHDNLTHGQPDLTWQTRLIQQLALSWEYTPAKCLGIALQHKATLAAEYLAENYAGMFNDFDWIRFNLIFGKVLHPENVDSDSDSDSDSSASAESVDSADSLNLLRKILKRHLNDARLADLVNGYFRNYERQLDNKQYQRLSNSDFFQDLSTDTTARIKRSWLNMPASRSYQSALIRFEEGLGGIQDSQQATNAFVKLLRAFVRESALMEEGVKNRTISVFQALIGREADINEQHPELGNRSPLAYAVHNRQYPTADLLLGELGADINFASANGGTTVLIEAAKARDKEAFPYLLYHGADKRQRDTSNRLPYDYFAGENFLTRRGSRWNAILAPNTALHIGMNLAGKIVVFAVGLPLSVVAMMIERNAAPVSNLLHYVLSNS